MFVTEFLRINFLCVITMNIFLETSRLKFVKKRICRKKKKGTKSRRNEEKKPRRSRSRKASMRKTNKPKIRKTRRTAMSEEDGE